MYPNGVLSTTFDSLPGAIREWLKYVCRVNRSFFPDVFLLGCCRWMQSVIQRLFSVATVNIFSSVDPTSLDEYFSNQFEWLSLAWQLTSLSSVAWRILLTNILQGSINAYYLSVYDWFIAESASKEFWKSVSNGQSYGQKYVGIFFPDTVYIISVIQLFFPHCGYKLKRGYIG